MKQTKRIVQTTTNRSVYNKARKYYLENCNEIRCSRCPYHDKENRDKKFYMGDSKSGIRYPSWKLVSKNKKQWMKKPIKVIKEKRREYRFIPDSDIITHYEIIW